MIESRASRAFWRAFSRLPERIRSDAKQAFRRFRENPYHPSLHFKKLEGQDRIYSVRISLGYRALGAVNGNRVVWFWIGSHADYDLEI